MPEILRHERGPFPPGLVPGQSLMFLHGLFSNCRLGDKIPPRIRGPPHDANRETA